MGTKAMLYVNFENLRLPIYSHYDGYPDGVPLCLAEHLVDNDNILQECGALMEKLAELRKGFESYEEFVKQNRTMIDGFVLLAFETNRTVYIDLNPPWGIEFEYSLYFTKAEDKFCLTMKKGSYNGIYGSTPYSLADYIKYYTKAR